MLSNNKDWFRYNRYFRSWERVLLRGGGDFTHQVAVELTPINDYPNEWNEIAEVKVSRRDVRYAAKPALSGDITWTHNLPDEIYDQMVKNLGKDKADFLIHADIYKLVDWNEFTKMGAGSKHSLHLVRRSLSINFRSVVVDEYGSREIYLTPNQFCLYADFSVPANSDLVAGVVINIDKHICNQMVIQYDHINRLTSVEINSSIPEKEEINTRIVGRHAERWNDRVLTYLEEMVSLGHFSENNIGVFREVTDNAWGLIQSGNI